MIYDGIHFLPLSMRDRQVKAEADATRAAATPPSTGGEGGGNLGALAACRASVVCRARPGRAEAPGGLGRGPGWARQLAAILAALPHSYVQHDGQTISGLLQRMQHSLMLSCAVIWWVLAPAHSHARADARSEKHAVLCYDTALGSHVASHPVLCYAVLCCAELCCAVLILPFR
jgi:hypothetical protein